LSLLVCEESEKSEKREGGRKKGGRESEKREVGRKKGGRELVPVLMFDLIDDSILFL
jgi:hypothetical protein